MKGMAGIFPKNVRYDFPKLLIFFIVCKKNQCSSLDKNILLEGLEPQCLFQLICVLPVSSGCRESSSFRLVGVFGSRFLSSLIQKTHYWISLLSYQLSFREIP